ncbi:DUF1987 domain-containing protein [Candidatus Magnetaquicoccus inordinatus]|uniref:DUF1987 domain-containing protein n=1 Tax=Candidatus Magnetaquicoccus inordinatus TaxID=2496818 RepID=UPI00102C1861|nr:DUF1987 domain-containing protein [Candidatus Magnetaquicoccus inordinatus]
METIHVEATERTPEIHFDFARNHFAIRGESYPEDVAEFYGPKVRSLAAHVGQLQGASIEFHFELIYFNSSSAKVLIGLFDLLDEAAEKNQVEIQWHYEADDANMEELGEEFGEDVSHATFRMVAKD